MSAARVQQSPSVTHAPVMGRGLPRVMIGVLWYFFLWSVRAPWFVPCPIAAAHAATLAVGLSDGARHRDLAFSQGMRLGHLARFTVFCSHMGPRSTTVLVRGRAATQRSQCASIRIGGVGQEVRSVTFLALRRTNFWAQPRGASKGVVVRALGAGGELGGELKRVVVTSRGDVLRARAVWKDRLRRVTYRFVIQGKRSVRMSIGATVLFRKRPLRGWGFPAFVSFYDYGVRTPMPPFATHLARHASDGLYVRTDKARLWEPLRDPRVFMSRFVAAGQVRVVGLLQVQRQARYYAQGSSHGQDAPNIFADFGSHGGGRVRLSEWPASVPGAPNIMAAFVPDAIIRPGRPWTTHFHVRWTLNPRSGDGVGRVWSTLIGGNAQTGARKYVIDYIGAALQRAHGSAVVVGHVRVRPETFTTQNTIGWNPYTKGFRQVIQVLPLPGRDVHIEAWLTVGGRKVSDVWSYDLLSPRISH